MKKVSFLKMKPGFQMKLVFVISLIVCFAAVLSGCHVRIHGEKHGAFAMGEGEGDGTSLSVVTTIFPYYDFIRQVGGEEISLSMVVPAGMDSHSFEPTPADMKLIQEADLFICNGGAMEHWVSQALDAIDTSSMKIITMMDYVEVFEEEEVEGMEGEHDHDENHDQREEKNAAGNRADTENGNHIENEDGHEEEIEYDEHIWTSPENAMIITEKITDALSEADPKNQDIYAKNGAAYLEALKGLDEDMRSVMKDRKRDMIVLGDKFPFRYLAETYDLNYRAAFSGCSTDTEPSARTIAYLIEKIRENRIPVVYYLELSSHRVAEIISEETGAKPLLLHSCHNVTRKEFESGITYLELMERNVESLRKGLDE